MLYLCELVQDQVIHKRFYREGSSAQAVREALDVFQWPAGQWRIEPADEGDDE